MARGQPGQATRWLIAELDRRGVSGKPGTIERLQRSGLAPKPRRPHKNDHDPGALWPPGAIQHYAAALPLMRQRHDCVDLAALTLLGWGYRVEKPTLDRAYAAAFTRRADDEQLADRIVERHSQHPLPFVGQLVRHLRSDERHRRDVSDELVFELASSLIAFAAGQMFTPERMMILLTARFGAQATSRFANLAPDVAQTILRVYARIASEFAATRLVQVARGNSAENLLAAQPMAANECDTELKALGGVVEDCPRCAEGRAVLVACMIPAIIRANELDWEALLR